MIELNWWTLCNGTHFDLLVMLEDDDAFFNYLYEVEDAEERDAS